MFRERLSARLIDETAAVQALKASFPRGQILAALMRNAALRGAIDEALAASQTYGDQLVGTQGHRAVVNCLPYPVRGRAVGFLPEATELAGSIMPLGTVGPGMMTRAEVSCATAVGTGEHLSREATYLLGLPVRL